MKNPAQQRFQSGSESLTIAIVAPCFNEEEVLPTSIPRMISLVKNLIENHDCSAKSYIVLVDDGSKDSTWELIAAAAKKFPNLVRGVRLSRNAGHQNALMAGLSYVTGRCDAAINIDVDLQDDLESLPLMVAEHRSGAEIVLGVKASRTADPLLKKITAWGFYKGMKWMGVDLVENHADCRLLSARALENLSKFPESALFLRGLQPLVHGRISTVTYHLGHRLAGQSKYPLRKMLSLALNGITSLSIVPLRLISGTGAVVFVISLIFETGAMVKALQGQTLPGWTSITVPLYLLGGLIILSIGIVGEYIGKIFLEVKRRPRFLVDEIAHEDRDVNAKQE